MGRKFCPHCFGELADDSHPAALSSDSAQYTEPSPSNPCRCQELLLLGLVDRRNSSINEIKERRRRERRSGEIRRRDKRRSASERRAGMHNTRADSRSRVDRRAGTRRTVIDQRWGIERRAYSWVKLCGDWTSAWNDASLPKPK